ncbi:hypothetical protein LSAT2_008544 [Lamellibrachia satsuma]|nr:hypothetical protein LSAT2_008544 [Lamellibrachia satsuma]
MSNTTSDNAFGRDLGEVTDPTSGATISWMWTPFVTLFLGIILLLAVSFLRHNKRRLDRYVVMANRASRKPFQMTVLDPDSSLFEEDQTVDMSFVRRQRQGHEFPTVAEAKRHGMSCRVGMLYVKPNVKEILHEAFTDMFQSPYYINQTCDFNSSGVVRPFSPDTSDMK